MKKFIINLKYGIDISKISFIILLIMSSAIAILVGFNQSAFYHSWVIQGTLSSHSLEYVKKGTIFEFWTTFLLYLSFFITPISSYYVSQDEDNNMNGFLIQYTSKRSLIFSRILILGFISLIVTLTAGIIYIITFYSINGMFINISYSLLCGFIIIYSLSLLGGLIGEIFKRKHWSIIISLFMVLLLFLISQTGRSMGNNYMDLIQRGHSLTPQEYISQYPLLFKIMIFSNPISLVETLNPILGFSPHPPDSISLLGLWGDIILGVLWIIALITAIYLVFYKRHKNIVRRMMI